MAEPPRSLRLTQTDGLPLTRDPLSGTPELRISALDLHEFLAIPTAYPDWITAEIAAYGFVQGRDYTGALLVGRAADIFLAPDRAQELAMLAPTPRGREVRQYFIRCAEILERPRDDTTMEAR